MEVVAEGLEWVRMRFLAAVLRDAGIEVAILDSNMASLGLGLVPQRLAVRSQDAARARRLLADADG